MLQRPADAPVSVEHSCRRAQQRVIPPAAGAARSVYAPETHSIDSQSIDQDLIGNARGAFLEGVEQNLRWTRLPLAGRGVEDLWVLQRADGVRQFLVDAQRGLDAGGLSTGVHWEIVRAAALAARASVPAHGLTASGLDNSGELDYRDPPARRILVPDPP